MGGGKGGKMDIQYRRDMNHTYMVLENGEAAVLESYETRILLTNRISGLLPCSLQYLDNRTCFCYDTTSRQSLASDLAGCEIACPEMRQILGNILTAMGRMEEYLLSHRHLVLTPEQIFLVPSTMEISLCFAPFFDGDEKEGLLKVTEFLLSRTAKTAQDAVILGSRFSHALRQPNVRLTDLERILYGDLPCQGPTLGNNDMSPAEAGEGMAAGFSGERWQAELSGGRAGAGNPELDWADPWIGRRRTEPESEGLESRPGRGGGENELPRFGSRRNRDKTLRGEARPDKDGRQAAGRRKKAQGTGVTWRIGSYVVAVVLAGAVVSAGLYVFLHYYNGKLPPWPILAAAAGILTATVILVIMIRRKMMLKADLGVREKNPESNPFDRKADSPYRAAYGDAANFGGAGFNQAAKMGNSRLNYAENMRDVGHDHAVNMGSDGLDYAAGTTGFGKAWAGAADTAWDSGIGKERTEWPEDWWSGSNPGFNGRFNGSGISDRPVMDTASGKTVAGTPPVEAGLTAVLSPPKKAQAEAFLVPEGPDAGGKLYLTKRRTRIGKLAGHTDICLGSPAVSRLHAEIVCRGTAFYIRDMNSRNGTRVNGELLTGNTEKLLREGDRLTLADRSFFFHVANAEKDTSDAKAEMAGAEKGTPSARGEEADAGETRQ